MVSPGHLEMTKSSVMKRSKSGILFCSLWSCLGRKKGAGGSQGPKSCSVSLLFLSCCDSGILKGNLPFSDYSLSNVESS